MDVEFKWNKPTKTIAKEASGGDRGLLFLANNAKRIMDPYVPAKNLVLAQNVRVYAENEAGIVQYISPYAHYQYEGVLYVDPKLGIGGFFIPGTGWRSRKGVGKVPSGKSLQHGKSSHPLATSKWDKAAMTARKGDLAKAYQSYLSGGAK